MASSGKWGQMKWREKSQPNDGLILHGGMRPIFARFSFMTFARDVNSPACCWYNADAVAGRVSVCVRVVWVYEWPRRSGDVAVSCTGNIVRTQ